LPSKEQEWKPLTYSGARPISIPVGHRNTGTFEGKMAETRGSTTVSTKLERIAKLACEMPQAALTTLAHNIDIDWLREAYRRARTEPLA
jgi:hypothetical protein